MKYFNYNERNFIDLFANHGYRVVHNVAASEPSVMNPETIRAIAAEIKANKEKIKRLILNFDKLEIWEKYNLLKNFYNCNTYLLEQYQLSRYDVSHPVIKKIKTDIRCSKEGHKNSKAIAIVRAQKGVWFTPFKTYSLSDIKILVNGGKIVVIGEEPYGKMEEPIAGGFEPQLNANILHTAFYATQISEESLEAMFASRPEAAEELFGDISLEQIKSDFELYYMPQYKACIKYLTECAKATAAREETTRKGLRRQIAKSNEVTKELDDVSKELLDTSKGR